MYSFFSTAGDLIKAMPFSGASWFVIATLALFVFLFARASRDPKSPIRWEDMVIDSSNDRASPYKVGYLVGVIVATWIVLTFTDKDKLTYDIFGMYLTYLLGGAGWNSFMKKDQPSLPTTPPAA